MKLIHSHLLLVAILLTMLYCFGRSGQDTTAKRQPQEFHLLGSMNATFCIHFKFSPQLPYYEIKLNTCPHLSSPHYTDKNWCENSVLVMHSSSDDYKPHELPKGVFLVCGDRAWRGLPPRLLGGPCTFGKLSLFTPNRTI